MPLFTRTLRWMVLATALVGCGSSTDLPDPPCPDEPAAVDDFTIAFTSSPGHPHVSDVITFSFSVQRAGAAVDGLKPSASYQHVSSGASGPITLSAKGAGQYVGTRAFFSAGTYRIGFELTDQNQKISRTFEIVVPAD